MNIVMLIKTSIQQAIAALYNKEISTEDLQINETKPEFTGDYTLVTFALTKLLQKKPDEIAHEIGHYLLSNDTLYTHFEVIKGFLNLTVSDQYYIGFLQQSFDHENYGQATIPPAKVMVEYSSPNTNKPLHFGHLRNIFLGHAVSAILKNAGNEVVKVNLINDRGIHICKSMIAWQLFANGATPESTHTKGDHLVGDYYVKFNDEYKEQVATLQNDGLNEEDAKKQAPILLAAQEMLRKWEAGDPETMELWQKMNDWVYAGFDVTYNKLGITFEKTYQESKTYLSGKSIVEKALANGLLYQKEDHSVWIDLTEAGLDQKLLLRGDGTSVYMTQDIGTAMLKYNDYHMNQSVYVIGDEQNYHMQVLKLILQKMKEPCADGIHHLSYGMVELPSGKMKSREGNVVDADDMVDEMTAIARKNTEELGKVDGFTDEELHRLYNTLGLGALKFYLLRVDPKKKMIFDPQESIDFHGFTGPFVQYSHARICSIMRKANAHNLNVDASQPFSLSVNEKNLLRLLEQYPVLMAQAAREMNPSVVCNAIYQVAKEFNSFLVGHSVLKAENENLKALRLQICLLCRHVIAHGLNLLGIDAPERM
ncbi:MAG: arginine--tRNA ligase [Chitinophagaceae bacterium]|nr:arginine--tRNA ligase [Chitinophagaceae bacterium]